MPTFGFAALATAYFLSVLIIGLRGPRTFVAYTTNPGRTGFLRLTLSLLATIVGGGMFLATAQLGFESAAIPIALGTSYLAGNVILGMLAPAIRVMLTSRSAGSLFELFDSLYPGDSRRRLGRLFESCSLLVFFLMLAGQYVAIATFVRHFWGLGPTAAVAVGSVAVAGLSIVVYSVSGGLSRDLAVDSLQLGCIVIAVSAIAFSVGPTTVVNSLRALPPSAFVLESSLATFFIGALLFAAPSFLVRFDLWQRIVTARSDRVARDSFFAAGVGSLLFFAFFGFLGLYGRAQGAQSPPLAGLEVLETLQGSIAYPIAVLGFAAAVMSSADTFLGVAGLAAYRIVQGPSSLAGGEAGPVPVGLRLSVLLVGAASIGLALLFQDIVDLFSAAFGVLIAFLPALAGGLREHRSPTRALASAGVGVGVVLLLAVWIPREAFLPGAIVSAAIYFLPERRGRSG